MSFVGSYDLYECKNDFRHVWHDYEVFAASIIYSLLGGMGEMGHALIGSNASHIMQTSRRFHFI